MEDNTYLQWQEEYAQILQPTGLTLPNGYGQARARGLGRFIASITKPSNWWIGDFCHQMEQRWGTDRQSLAATLEISIDTLYNITAVCKAIPISRRREHLSFSHHEAVCAKEGHVADSMLETAEEERLSVAKLRAIVSGKEDTLESTSLTRTRSARLPVHKTEETPASVSQGVNTEASDFSPSPSLRLQNEERNIVLPRDLSARLKAVSATHEAAEELACKIIAEWLLMNKPVARFTRMELMANA